MAWWANGSGAERTRRSSTDRSTATSVSVRMVVAPTSNTSTKYYRYSTPGRSLPLMSG
uniref:Uncharacterized protein n=1 Tax=Anopheles minimus TaxID=112268 RepID=A0A182VX20_9DIPT